MGCTYMLQKISSWSPARYIIKAKEIYDVSGAIYDIPFGPLVIRHPSKLKSSQISFPAFSIFLSVTNSLQQPLQASFRLGVIIDLAHNISSIFYL